MLELLGFEVGLKAMLTPTLFPLIFLHSFLILRLDTDNFKFKTNLKLYSIVLITWFLINSLLTNCDDFLLRFFEISKLFLAIFPFIYLLLIGVVIWEIVNEKFTIKKFRFLILIFLGTHLYFCSLSNTVPLMVMNVIEKEIIFNIRVLLSFSIGLLIPFLLVTVILKTLSKNNVQSKIWKTIQVIGLLWFLFILLKEYFIYL